MLVALVEKDERRRVILSIVYTEHDIGSNGNEAKGKDIILQAFSKRFGRLKCAVIVDAGIVEEMKSKVQKASKSRVMYLAVNNRPERIE